MFRDFAPLLALSPAQITLITGAIAACFLATTALMFVVLKVLQRETAYLQRGVSFLKVLDVRLIFWTLYTFIALLDVEPVQLAWMTGVSVLLLVVAYEFLFDLGAIKTSAAIAIDITLTLGSVVAILYVLQAVTGPLNLGILGL